MLAVTHTKKVLYELSKAYERRKLTKAIIFRARRCKFFQLVFHNNCAEQTLVTQISILNQCSK